MYQHQIRVYAEDVDYMGIVYHSNYIKYFERARTELLRHHNLILSELSDLDILFAIHEISVLYKLPAKLDDFLTITTEIKEVKSCRFVFKQCMHNQLEQLVCEANIHVVCVNKNLRPKRVPDFLQLS